MKRLITLVGIYSVAGQKKTSVFPQCFQTRCEENPKSSKTSRPKPCEPEDSELNLARIATVTVSPDEATCAKMPSEDGKDESKYCGYYNQGSCSICQKDASSALNRFPDKMNDPYPDTFWHSEPWPKYDYIADERSGYTKEYQINITLDLKRLVLLTSDIIITFTEAKPAEMVVEKSSNDGVSWSPIEFFSRNCSKINGLYENEWSSKFGSSIWKRPNCSEDVASWDAISTGRDLTVHIADKIRAMRGWSVAQTCKTLYNGNASDTKDPEPAIKFFLANKIRIRLLRPGFKNKRTNWQSLHYGISNINFSGRCYCYGHAGSCTIDSSTGQLTCACSHDTSGVECDTCKNGFTRQSSSLGSGISYSPRNANSCNQTSRLLSPYGSSSCDCNGHSDRCEGVGTQTICAACLHNTLGPNCETCRRGYYPNKNRPVSAIDYCQPCNCNPKGRLDDSCTNGICSCQVGYVGRTCGECDAAKNYVWEQATSTCKQKICSSTIVGFFCQNNGTCVDSEDRCQCTPKYKGKLCEEVNPSSSRRTLTNLFCLLIPLLLFLF